LLSDVSNSDLAFDGFVLSAAQRRLTRDGAPVDVSGRYLDALLLLARSPGELVTKDRFMAEVWRGVPVTDEALTQCIRTLRKALGDQAGRPRYIETIPRHGYRFVAEVSSVRDHPTEPLRGPEPSSAPRSPSPRSEFLLVASAGLVGGAAAGLLGGIGYGLLAATEPPAGTGAVSILLVMTCLCLLVGLLGGLGVGSGTAIGRLVGRGRLFPLMAGGAIGGMVVGALGRLVGLDAFSLLIGSRPLAITGGSEGLLIGALAGAAFWLAERASSAPPSAVAGKGALLGALAGLLVTLGGGKMMAGSLAGLAAAHPDAPLGRLLGDPSPPLLLAAGATEGAIFVAALTLAFALVLRSRSAASP
jgi:DNA-binding winged helix-turn-helix (wHTH) protein